MDYEKSWKDFVKRVLPEHESQVAAEWNCPHYYQNQFTGVE